MVNGMAEILAGATQFLTWITTSFTALTTWVLGDDFLLLPFRRRLPISVRLFYICLFSCVLLYCCLSRLLLSYRL